MPPLAAQGGLESSEASSGDRFYLVPCLSGTGVSRVIVQDPSAADELRRNELHPWLTLPTALFTGSARTQVAGFLSAQMRAAVLSDSPGHAAAILDGLLVEITATTDPGACETDVQIGVPPVAGSTAAACPE